MKLTLQLDDATDIQQAFEVLVALCTGLGQPCHVVWGAGAVHAPDDAPTTGLGEELPTDPAQITLDEALAEAEAEAPAPRRAPRRRRPRAAGIDTQIATGGAVVVSPEAMKATPDVAAITYGARPAVEATPELFLRLVEQTSVQAALQALAAAGLKRFTDGTDTQRLAVIDALVKAGGRLD